MSAAVDLTSLSCQTTAKKRRGDKVASDGMICLLLPKTFPFLTALASILLTPAVTAPLSMLCTSGWPFLGLVLPLT